MSPENRWTRRHFLASSVVAGLTAGTLSPFEALADRRRRRRRLHYHRREDEPDRHEANRQGRDPARHQNASLGPLAAVADQSTGLPLLELPNGFKYVSFGWTRDRLDEGEPAPA